MRLNLSVLAAFVALLLAARAQLVTPFMVFNCEQTTCQFYAYNALDPAWDFGDGTTDTGPHVAHTYARPGTYSVTLETRDEVVTRTVQVYGPCTTKRNGRCRW